MSDHKYPMRTLLLALMLSFVATFQQPSIGNGDVIDFNTTLGSDYTASQTQIVDSPSGPVEVVLDGGNAGDVFVNGSSRFRVESGSFTDFRVFDDAEAVIRGGTSSGDVTATFDRSRLSVFGGAFEDNIVALGESSIEVFGGVFRQKFGATDNSVLTFFGTQLQATVVGGDPSIPTVDHRVTGVFADLTPFTTNVFVTPDASLVLRVVPEPTSAHIALMACVFFSGCFRRHANRGHGNEKPRIGPQLSPCN